jgi:hypothetical protein
MSSARAKTTLESRSIEGASSSETFSCPSCGTESAGPFCTHCGERRLGSDDRSLRHYLDIIIDHLTHFDSKGYRSLRYLLTKPGFLSAEQLRGRRVRYAKPLSLFISINVVYYLSIGFFGVNTFSTPLAIQLNQNDYYAGIAQQQVARHLARTPTDFPTFETRYNERTGVLSKTLIFLFIPIYAAIFYALFFNRLPYIAAHAVVATHLWSFILVVLAAVVPAVALGFVAFSGSPTVAAALASHDNPVSIFIQCVVAVYLFVMLRRVYATSVWYAGGVAVAIAWSFFHLVWLYRFMLFIITLHSL